MIRHVSIIASIFLLIGCQDESLTSDDLAPAKTKAISVEEPATPPTPPFTEDFEGEPKMSLFPRVGDYRPTENERLPYWSTFIEHLTKVSGIIQHKDNDNRAWSFRSINTIDSVGYFAPLAVDASTTYRVTFKILCELPEDARAGIGVLQYDQFLWQAEQYSEELHQQHYRGIHQGASHTSSPDWVDLDFNFTTGPDTAMVHLVLFREGEHARSPILFDDISIKASPAPETKGAATNL